MSNSCTSCGAPLPRAVHVPHRPERHGKARTSYRPRLCHACVARMSKNLTPKGIARLKRRAAGAL